MDTDPHRGITGARLGYDDGTVTAVKALFETTASASDSTQARLDLRLF